MKRILSVATVMFFALGGIAHAALEDIGLSSTDGDFTFTSTGGSLSPNINLTTALTTPEGSTDMLVLNNNSNILTTGTSTATLPSGTLFGGNYLAVQGDTSTGMSTFTLAPNQHSFGFTWGSIDDFNTLVITDSRGDRFMITGTELLAAIGGVDGTTQQDVDITDSFGTIVSAVLASTKNAFEGANFSESNVPLPAALPLFGAGLLGLVLFARRRRQQAKA